MRKIGMIAILALVLASCSDTLIDEPTNNTFVEEETQEEIQVPTDKQIELSTNAALAFAGLKSTLETTLLTIFQYPQIHGANFGSGQVERRSMECPMITPDPNEPIVAYPMEYDIDFGEDGCSINDHPIPSKGKMKIIVDGEICVAEGANIKIKPEEGFTVNNFTCSVKDEGCIEMTYRGRDEDGNMVFDADLSNVLVTDLTTGATICLDQMDDAVITLKDTEGNSTTDDFATYLDDEVCLTFSFFYCGVESTVYRMVPWLKLDGSYNPVGFHWSQKCPSTGGFDIWSGDRADEHGLPDASVGWHDNGMVTIDGVEYDLSLCN